MEVLAEHRIELHHSMGTRVAAPHVRTEKDHVRTPGETHRLVDRKIRRSFAVLEDQSHSAAGLVVHSTPEDSESAIFEVAGTPAVPGLGVHRTADVAEIEQ